jgi:hypothetical protein
MSALRICNSGFVHISTKNQLAVSSYIINLSISGGCSNHKKHFLGKPYKYHLRPGYGSDKLLLKRNEIKTTPAPHATQFYRRKKIKQHTMKNQFRKPGELGCICESFYIGFSKYIHWR